MSNLLELCVRREASIRDAMAAIDRGQRGMVLVVDGLGRLEGMITDGDIRRAMLASVSLDSSIEDLLRRKSGTDFEVPVTALYGSNEDDLHDLMRERKIRQLPLVDEHGTVMDVVTLDDFRDGEELPFQAVIMAGGFGKRLRPLTDDTPKPMLSVGGKPLMERTVKRLRDAGIRRINITTHYLPQKITNHFGDGSDFGVDVNYVSEDRPLGTAGSLGLVGETDEPMLVMNGDILTGVNFRDLVNMHRKERADLTVAVRQYDFQVPYGVVDAENGVVTKLREKPKYTFLVNAGIYVVEPSVRSFIPPNTKYDMTDLIDALIQAGRVVSVFPVIEYWLDIGQHDDFARAEQDIKQMRWAA